jgi:hypothetical protein
MVLVTGVHGSTAIPSGDRHIAAGGGRFAIALPLLMWTKLDGWG